MRSIVSKLSSRGLTRDSFGIKLLHAHETHFTPHQVLQYYNFLYVFLSPPGATMTKRLTPSLGRVDRYCHYNVIDGHFATFFFTVSLWKKSSE